MTVSQHSEDKGNLHLFDAVFAHTGRQVKRETSWIKRTVSLYLCDAACVWLLHEEITFNFCV